jgi:HSP20 family protein
VSESDIHVHLAGDMLAIKGKGEEEREKKNKNCRLSGRSFGMIEYSFQPPDVIDAERINASFKNCVLEIMLPKNLEPLRLNGASR